MSTMKGGREVVDAPFWSWDTGFSGTCWPEWPQKEVPKTHFFLKEMFFGLDWRSQSFTFCNAMQIVHKTVLFLMYLFISQLQCTLTFAKTGYNFATDDPNDLIFLAPILKLKFIFMVVLLSRTINLDQPFQSFRRFLKPDQPIHFRVIWGSNNYLECGSISLLKTFIAYPWQHHVKAQT